MKKVVLNMGKVLALGGTAWLMLANSVEPVCAPEGPVDFEITQSGCGPTGQVTVNVNGACQVQMDGAEAVNLFPRGERGDGEQTALAGSTWWMGLRYSSIPNEPPHIRPATGEAFSNCEFDGPNSSFECVDDAGAVICGGDMQRVP